MDEPHRRWPMFHLVKKRARLLEDMLDATGASTIEAVRRDVVLRPTPIMAVTAYAGKGDEDRIREAGADAFVSKPITLARFMQSIDELSELADARALH
jgi:two-component system cell cycle response regulator DivK